MRAKDYNIDVSGFSLPELRRFYSTAIKAANDRIETLTKAANIGGAQAYKYIVQPLQGASYIKQRGGATVFKSPGRKADASILKEAITQVQRFLAAKTSTVAGIKEVQAERRKYIDQIMNEERRRRGSAPEGGSGLSEKDKDAILRWLGSPEGKEAKQNFDSNNLVEAITKAMVTNRAGGGGASPLDLWRQFEERQSGLLEWIRENDDLLDDMEGF